MRSYENYAFLGKIGLTLPREIDEVLRLLAGGGIYCFCYCLFMEFSLSCNGFNNEAKYFLKWPQFKIVNLLLHGHFFLSDEP